MKKTPMLDLRTKEDILQEIMDKSESYTPEWRYHGTPGDAGGALAELFASLFSETIDRYNRVPHKNYMAFLNLLDVRQSPVTPAKGVVKFSVETEGNESVLIPAGTELYPSSTEGYDTPYFETDSSFEASSAQITDMLCVDPVADLIQKIDIQGGLIRFFRADPSQNLQKHRFSIGESYMLRLKHPCEITIKLEHVVNYYTKKCVDMLVDPKLCKWTYLSQEEELEFTRVYAKDGCICLIKDNDTEIVSLRQNSLPSDEAVEADGVGENNCCIFCTMLTSLAMPEIKVKSVSIKSAFLEDEDAKPDALFFNENPADFEDGIYCFGTAPIEYDCFYISSGEVLSKRGARVLLSFDMKTLLREQIGENEQYTFSKKYVIGKEEKKTNIKDIFIADVVWEYWNGRGWTVLRTEGNRNPFSCTEEGKKDIRFICPTDIELTDVNAIEAFWMRARATRVENAYDNTGRYRLPYAQNMRFSYSYDDFYPAATVGSDNNCEKVLIENADRIGNLQLVLYKALIKDGTAQYIAFDRPFSGHPVTIHFDVECSDRTDRVLEYQLYGEKGFENVRVLDQTDGLKKSGIVSLFVSSPPIMKELFGIEACWLRIVDLKSCHAAQKISKLKIRAVTMNVANITEKHTMPDEYFSAEPFELNKELYLLARPVQEAEVWVNEASISQHQLDELIESEPDSVDIRCSDDGFCREIWVRWKELSAMYTADKETRCYTLDVMKGTITFGDGTHGRTPEAGESSIMVKYSTGGGRRGNLKAGDIDSIATGIAGVAEVYNISPTYGGNDIQSVETIEKIGPMRIRHRNRALTAEDFENLVLEEYSQVKDVRCFTGLNEKGEKATGHITVVVMAEDYQNQSYGLLLADEVMESLKRKCDMSVLSAGFLHVIPVNVITVNCSVKLLLGDYNSAVITERDTKTELKKMIESKLVGGHFIGNLPSKTDVYSTLKGIKNIAAVEQVLLEGCYYIQGNKKVVSLDGKKAPDPFAVALDGIHRIKLEK